MICKIFCSFRVAGFHHWPDAPEPFSYLSSVHRHEFHFRVEKYVSHDNRDIEFIDLKTRARIWVEDRMRSPDTLSWSCERWAFELLHEFCAARVEVSEDGENGASVSV